MKYKMIYGSKDDDFIWKMETVYNPIEKLHLKLAKWHLRKLVKVDKEMLDKLWLECYNSIIKKLYSFNPPIETSSVCSATAEDIIKAMEKFKILEKDADKIVDEINSVGCINAVSTKDLETALEYTNHMWDNCYLYPIDIDCNAVVKLEGVEDESNN